MTTANHRPLSLDKLDNSLAAEMDAPADQWSMAELPLLDDAGFATNNSLQIVFHANSGRGGVVMVGSGSNGVTAWTDANSLQDVLQRYLGSELIN